MSTIYGIDISVTYYALMVNYKTNKDSVAHNFMVRENKTQIP